MFNLSMETRIYCKLVRLNLYLALIDMRRNMITQYI